jgi:hypothetical protein
MTGLLAHRTQIDEPAMAIAIAVMMRTFTAPELPASGDQSVLQPVGEQARGGFDYPLTML